MTDKLGFLQRRHSLDVGPFHVWGGDQLEPHKEMVVGHAHEQPHLMVLTRPPIHECPHCKGELKQPKYLIRGLTADGIEIAREFNAYDIIYVRAGTHHSVEQLVDGALGGFACIFSRYDENGTKMDDPKRQPTSGVSYG